VGRLSLDFWRDFGSPANDGVQGPRPIFLMGSVAKLEHEYLTAFSWVDPVTSDPTRSGYDAVFGVPLELVPFLALRMSESEISSV